MIARTDLLAGCAIGLLSLGGAALFVMLVLHRHGPLRRALHAYLEHLDRELRFVRAAARGLDILRWQLLALLVLGSLALSLSMPLTLLIVPAVAIAPYLNLKNRRQARVTRVEQQLDGWLLALANALQAVPSLGDGLVSSQALTHAPIAEELDLVMKEYKLGTPLDQALANMGQRLGSRVVSAALITLQVARRTGGDLPTTLQIAAANLREMSRLEGVVRAKTADGRNQAWAIGVMPAVLSAFLSTVHPDLFDPLLDTGTGNLLLALAVGMWLLAVVLALRILAVDI